MEIAKRALAPARVYHQFVTRYTEGLSHFVTSMDCSGCFRLERSPGGTCTHWKAPPSHGAYFATYL